ncbi:MAG: IS1595 family transposase [Spirochaetes bacterium]|uniref:IS1595 family transposase n=1 Tax=Candidatus Aphodenecus pullistercoris TaxID=2840669 RepID=A0A9D9EBP8_9SPIR|nr:IS1595 family transposase [Candidatus Aphodenecus pullistercoris]
MEELSFAEYLRKEMGLDDYQISKMQELLASFEQTEDMSAATDGVEICPKCGTAHPKVVRSGFAGSGKQMFRCASFGRRFTYDSGRLTWYSHQNADQWKTLMLDTFSGQSLRSTSGRIGVNVETAFNMRHRLMCVLEKVLDDEVLSGKVELDETYVDSSRKGVGCGRDAGFGTVVQKVKRGLSRQKVCILSAVDKDGNAFARAYNCGTPSQDNAMELACHLADDSSVTTDDTVAYERLLESNGCFHRVCQDCRDHKAEVNLNRISSFHSMIKDFYRGYRGVATKYINRYAAVFSFIWKFRKLKDGDLHGKIKAMVDKSGFAIRTGVVQTYRLFTPQDIEWVVAS